MSSVDDLSLAQEIKRLERSEAVRLAMRWEERRFTQLNRINELRKLEVKGMALMAAGVTLDDLEGSV